MCSTEMWLIQEHNIWEGISLPHLFPYCYIVWRAMIKLNSPLGLIKYFWFFMNLVMYRRKEWENLPLSLILRYNYSHQIKWKNIFKYLRDVFWNIENLLMQNKLWINVSYNSTLCWHAPTPRCDVALMTAQQSVSDPYVCPCSGISQLLFTHSTL